MHLEHARAALTRLYTALDGVQGDGQPLDWNEENAMRFAEAMDDDFNTPVAIAVLFDLVSELNKSKSPVLARQLKGLADVIGLLGRTPQQFLQAAVGGADTSGDGAIVAAIAQRSEAKKARNFAESDKIRAELLAAGIILEDKPDGTTNWRRA